jgi:hypothetical protein
MFLFTFSILQHNPDERNLYSRMPRYCLVPDILLPSYYFILLARFALANQEDKINGKE